MTYLDDLLRRAPSMRPIHKPDETLPDLKETDETWCGEHLIRSVKTISERLEDLNGGQKIPARLRATRERRAKVAELFAQGMTPNDIAATIKGSYSTTKKDLRAMGLRK